MRRALLILPILALTGCFAQTSVRGTPASSAAGLNLAPHSRPVWVSENNLPAGVKFTLVETIRANERGGYGEITGIDKDMADRARAVGADAVINVKRWRQPTAFGSWSAPHGTGEAVKIENRESLNLGGMPGRWL